MAKSRKINGGDVQLPLKRAKTLKKENKTNLLVTEPDQEDNHLTPWRRKSNSKEKPGNNVALQSIRIATKQYRKVNYKHNVI